MYSLKLELKLNNFERSKLAGGAGFGRLVYNARAIAAYPIMGTSGN